MTQIECIEAMEKIFDEVRAAVGSLEAALDTYEAVQDKFDQLDDYYSGDVWMEDFEADEAGKIPKNLKRGVLSEDGVYDLITRDRELNARMADILGKYLRKGQE